MPSLRSIANQYHHAANRIAARADRVGELTENQRKGIESFRDAAAKIEALIRPEDSAGKITPELLAEGFAATITPAPKKFKAHKAATPQELLEKAQ
jgi:hypothetical protein